MAKFSDPTLCQPTAGTNHEHLSLQPNGQDDHRRRTCANTTTAEIHQGHPHLPASAPCRHIPIEMAAHAVNMMHTSSTKSTRHPKHLRHTSWIRPRTAHLTVSLLLCLITADAAWLYFASTH